MRPIRHRLPLGRLARLAVWCVLVLGVVAFAIGTVVRHGRHGQVALLDLWDYSLVYLCAGVLLLTRWTPRRSERLAWRLIGVASISNVGANLYFSLVLMRMVDPPYPSLADAIYLAWYPLVYVAGFLLVRAQMPQLHVSVALDGLIAGLGVTAVSMTWVLNGVVGLHGGSLSEVLVNLAYPVGDLLLLALLVAGTTMQGLNPPRSGLILTVSLLITTGADVVYLVQDSAGSYVEGSWVDLLWLLGTLILPVAAQASPSRPPAWSPGEPGAVQPVGPAGASSAGQVSSWLRLDLRALSLPLVFTALSLAVVVLAQFHLAPIPAAMFADACVLTALARSAWSFREVRRNEQADFAAAHRQARTDHLTGLPNRLALSERCQERMRSAVGRRRTCLLLLDLDRFKEVNDALGHTGGDQLLRQVAARIQTELHPTDLIARVGGDEFAVLISDAPLTAAVARAHAVRTALESPFRVDDLFLHVDASIGVAAGGQPASDYEELLHCADVAMYRAKHQRCQVSVYAAGDPVIDGDRLRLTEELRGALLGRRPDQHGHLVVHFQPQASIQPRTATGAEPIVGVEALVRWQHPRHGLMLPDRFLPLAGAAGLMGQIADLVLEQAAAACAQWRRDGHPIPVSVNLTARDLRDPALPTRISTALARHGLPGEALVVEIVEDTLMTDPDCGGQILAALRRAGISVSIDDYGTGYSSLAYLCRLPIDELKLDRMFIDRSGDDPAARAIIRSTVDLAHALGLRVVAEGVQDAATLERLADAGCDVVQGYHVARPMPAKTLDRWLAGRPALTTPR